MHIARLTGGACLLPLVICGCQANPAARSVENVAAQAKAVTQVLTDPQVSDAFKSTVSTAIKATAGRDVQTVTNEGRTTRAYIRWMGAIMLAGVLLPLVIGLIVLAVLLRKWGYTPENWTKKLLHLNGSAADG